MAWTHIAAAVGETARPAPEETICGVISRLCDDVQDGRKPQPGDLKLVALHFALKRSRSAKAGLSEIASAFAGSLARARVEGLLPTGEEP